MTTKRALLSAGALLALLAGGLIIAQTVVGSDNDSVGTNGASPTSPAPTTVSPTSASAKEQVREAYLRQWDVYARAVRTLNSQGLDEVFTGKALEALRREIRDLRTDDLGVRVRVKHHIRIHIADPATALVVDRYENHSVAFDLKTGKATEADPQEIILEAYTLKKVDGAWKVSAIDRQSVRPIKR